MQFRVIIILLASFFFSCFTEKKTDNTLINKKDKISLKIIGTPNLKDTLRIKKNKTIVIKEPFLSYRAKGDFVQKKLNISDSTNFNINEKDIFLKIRYDFNKLKTFNLLDGDSVIVNYTNNKMPFVRVINRKTKKYDYSIYEFYSKYETPLDFYGYYKKFGKFRSPIEEDLYKKKMNTISLKKIKGLDSLKNQGLLSDNTHNFYRKSITYMLKHNKDSIHKLINVNNNDIHIDTYRGLLMKYVLNQLDVKLIKSSNGASLNSVGAFDFTYNNPNFNKKTKDFLLWLYLKDIAKNFSEEQLQTRFKKFSSTSSNNELIKDLKNEFLIEYSELKKETERVVLINPERKKSSLKDILDKNKGKVLFIDFWASWCKPCRSAMKKSKQKIAKYKNEEIVFIYISIDKSSKDWKNAVIEENLYLYKNNFLAINYPNASFFKQLNISSIPRYLVFNKEGELAYKNALSPDNENFDDFVKDYINK